MAIEEQFLKPLRQTRRAALWLAALLGTVGLTGWLAHVGTLIAGMIAVLSVAILLLTRKLQEMEARRADERERNAEQERIAAAYARSLLEASLDPLVTISPQGRITDVNEATVRVTGVPREQLIGTEFSDYFTEPAKAQAGYREVFDRGLVRDYPLTIRDRGGRLTEVLYNATVYQDASGQVRGVFAAARDVTARNRAERDLRRVNRALKALSRCNDAVARATDETALLQEVCDLAVQIAGYRLAWIGYAEHDAEKTVRPMAVAGNGIDYVAEARITWADNDRGRGPTGTVLRTGKPCFIADIATDRRVAPWREAAIRHGYRSVMTAPLKDGEQAFGTVNFYAGERDAFDEEERGLVEELAANVSHGILALRAREARQHAEAEVRRLNAELEQRVSQRTAQLEAANKELEAFTYSVAHDLRAPLRHTDGFARLLAEDNREKLSEESVSYLDHILSGTSQMGRLIDDLLNLSRVGRQQLHPEVVGLNRVVEDVVESLRPEIGARNVRWQIAPLPFTECDALLVRQVFQNLLANAVKFTRPRDPAVIEVGQKTIDGETVMFVRDNGVGFNMKYADKLFGVFQRLHRQEDFEGTGVGLVTVQRILQKHGGRIWAEAQLDRGAAFYFTLQPPVTHDEASAEPEGELVSQSKGEGA